MCPKSGKLSIDRAYRILTTNVKQIDDDEISLDEHSMWADGEERIEMDYYGSEGEEVEVHILTKKECKQLGAIGTKMKSRDRCQMIYNQDGQLLDVRIAMNDSEKQYA